MDGFYKISKDLNNSLDCILQSCEISQELGISVTPQIRELDEIEILLKAILKRVKTAKLNIEENNIEKNKDIKDTIVKNDKVYNKTYKELVPSFKTKVIEVSSYDDIPISYLYYHIVNQEFAININGVLLKGNIGEIFTTSRKTKNILNTSINDYPPDAKQTMFCKNTNCKNILCNYYHDPINTNIPQIKNYSNLQWIYNTKRESARHFGNRSSLLVDLYNAKPTDIKNWQCQTIHCILVGIVANHFLMRARANK